MELSFAIDISGILPEQDSVIGLAAFPSQTKSNLIKRFNKKFSKLLNKKGKSLKGRELRNILSFLDENDVKMVGVKCTKVNWNKRFSNLPTNISYKKEKLYGILYFLALKEVSERGRLYDVVVCKDTFMRIEKALIACKKLAKYYGHEYNFSLSSGNLNPAIKIADYIASAGRKFRASYLNEIEHFKLLVSDIPYDYIRYVFDLYKTKK